MAVYPAYLAIGGIICYAIAYWIYAKWYDKNVWEPDPKRTTPAHMYMDGIEFFPTSKYVLYGFQFKGIAALGPILGPFIALTYGWLPAFIWILLGNFFIGWIHDYSSIMLSVRNEGKSFGPLSYELFSARSRKALIGFIWFYLLIIAAVFILLCGLFFKLWPASVAATLFTIIGGLISGWMLYKARINIIASTIVGLVITIIGIWLGATYPDIFALGGQSLEFWMIVVCIIVFIGAVLPIIYFTQPVNYIAFYPCFIGVIVLLVGALLTPAWGITIQQPDFVGWFSEAAGPIWPILTVSIACGAISGWHSLVGSSGTAKQLDVETDALPVGAGSMLGEGLLALSALTAYVVLTPEQVSALHAVKWSCFVEGATLITKNMFGGDAAVPFLNAFFAMFLELYAITVLMLVIRFWRMSTAEVTEGVPPLHAILKNKYIGAIVGLIIAFIFAYTGSWINLWLLFGGSNQLLSGLALFLVSAYLVRIKKPTGFTLGPGIFQFITCEAALIWIVYVFFKAVLGGTPITKGALAAYPEVGLALNAIFGVIGIILIILGIVVAIDFAKAYSEAKKA